MVLGVYKPSSPPVIPTPESYLEEALATNSSIIYCVPSFVEVRWMIVQNTVSAKSDLSQAWFREPSNIPAIKSFRAIVRSSFSYCLVFFHDASSVPSRLVVRH